MIVDRKFSVQEEVSGDFEGIDASLSLDDMGLIFSIVSENFYSDLEGSIVRELASNCVDSHTEAGVEDPIVIKYSDIEGQEFISFIDVGTGLSPERFKDIYMRYFRSTKRESNEYVGYFGIGSKSPLGYTDSFEVVTRSEGKEYHYIVGKSETGKPRADLFSTKDTVERNGTEIRIAINTGDYDKFRNAIRKQLIYFDNVYVDGFDVDNGFNVVEGETFKYRYSLTSGESHPYESLHISFGKVVYPIQWSSLGREEIKLPLGVKFNIGELSVTNNREQIIYSDEAKELINNRIDKVLSEIRDIYNNQNSMELSLPEYLKARNRLSKNVKLGYSYLKLPTRKVLKHNSSYEYVDEDIIKGLNVGQYKSFIGTPLVVPDKPFFMFRITDKIDELTIRKRKPSQHKSEIDKNDIENIFIYPSSSYSKYYFIRNKDKRNNKVDKYIVHKEITSPSTVANRILLVEKKKASLSNLEDYLAYLNLIGDSKERDKIRKTRNAIWRNLIDADIEAKEPSRISSIPYITEEWNKTKLVKFYRDTITKELEDNIKEYDAVSETFEYRIYLDSIKVQRQHVRREGVINAYCMESKSEIKLDLSTLEGHTGLILYSYKGDSDRLRPLYEAVKNVLRIKRSTKKAIRGYLIGKTFFKHFQQNPYFMSVDEFLSNGNSIIQKMVTAHIIKKRYIKDIRLKYVTLSNYLHDIAPSVDQKEKELVKFVNRYSFSLDSLERTNSSLLSEMVDIVVSNNWIIPHYVQELEPIEKFYDQLELFEYIQTEAFDNEVAKNRIIEYLKFKKKKLNAIYYFVPTAEERKILEDAEKQEKYKKELAAMRNSSTFLSYEFHETPYFNND